LKGKLLLFDLFGFSAGFFRFGILFLLNSVQTGFYGSVLFLPFI
jgi:hypothetical protein